MEFNKLVFGGLAAGCLVAAGAGSYLAVRQNASTAAAPVVATSDTAAAPADTTAAPASAPVAESEGIVTPVAEKAPPPEEPEPSRPAPVRQSRTRERASRPEPPRPAPVAHVEPTAPAAPSTAPPPSGSMWEARPAVEPTLPEQTPPPPPEPQFVELVIPADSVVGLQVERTVTSENAEVEDRVSARVTRDVHVGDRVAIPAGAVVQGSVTEVERGGKVKETARLGIRFHTVVLADGSHLAIRTEPIVRVGQSPAGESAAKIGGAAAGGAILGAILGGGKGAAIGGAIGAAGGTAATMAGDRNPAVLPQGTRVTVRIQQPVTVSVEKQER